MTQWDLVVIGGGPGGYVAALRAAGLGLKVAVIEKQHLGGVCLNWGCIPTKSLLKSAHFFEKAHHLSSFGVSVEHIAADLLKMVRRSREVSETLAKGVAYLLKKRGVTVIKGHAHLLKADTPFQIAVEGSKEILEAPHVILATGARARELPFLKRGQAWTAHEAMLPETLPPRLLIIGAGAIGIEFASFYAALGTKVTVLEQHDRILPTEDAEIAEIAQKLLEKKGIAFILGQTLQKCEAVGDLKEATCSGGAVWKGEQVLLAVGIIGNTEKLGLEKSKVRIDRGHIVVSPFQETDQPQLYAIGDVAGPPWLAHKASHEGILCAERIAGHSVTPINPLCIPGCVYSAPQVASVGLTEKAALEKGMSIKIGRFPFSANGQALALGEEEGLVKVLFDTVTGELLGAHMVGAGVTELIQGFAIAKTLEATEEALRHVIFPHPTLSEAMHEAVLDADGMALHKAS